MKQILIVEDDTTISQMVNEYLEQYGYRCIQAFTGKEAKEVFAMHPFDLVLLDLMLPEVPGEALITEMSRQASVIVVSAKNQVYDKVNLLTMGANDYICKPFDLKELLARVQVQLREKTNTETLLTYKAWKLDLVGKQFYVADNEIEVTAHEFKILELFMRHPRQVFTKQAIYEYAWEEDYYVGDKTINVHISNIRMKLKPTNTEDYIQTVWGMGFKLKN